MADRGDPWDSRASHESDEGRGRGHARQESTASTVIGVQPQKEGYDGYDTYRSRGSEPQYTDNQLTGRPHPGGY